jgi:hypothetical protein
MPFATAVYTDWETIAITAAAISVVASAMLIIFSRMLALRNLEQTAKMEFVYAVSTVFIVLMVLGLIEVGEPLLGMIAKQLYLAGFGCDPYTPIALEYYVDPSLPQPELTAPENLIPVTTLIDYMKLYMQPPVKCAQEALDYLYIASIPVESIASVYIEVYMSEPATGFGIKAIAERIKNTTQILSFYVYFYYVLVHSFNFIKYYAGFFFSVGVALRAFPPTRGAGAYLMAASLGFYFIFPTAYIMVSTVALPHGEIDILPPGGCDEAMFNRDLPYRCSIPAEPPHIHDPCGSTRFSNVWKSREVVKEAKEELMTFLDYQKGGVGKLLIHLITAVCLAPLISLVLVMTFVLNSTNLLGGNIPEIGRGLVKLI